MPPVAPPCIQNEGQSTANDTPPDDEVDVEDSVAAPSTRRDEEPLEYQGEEFHQLFMRWRATGDARMRERLILMHRSLVIYLARRFMDRGEFDDIVQQGMIGLMHALDHFDPTRGVRFATFATPTIIGEIRRYFRDKTWALRVPRRMQELNQAISQKIEALTQEMNHSPTYQEIARSMGLEVEDVIEAMEVAHALEPASLDEVVPSEHEGVSSVADQIGKVDPALEQWDDHDALQAALQKLPPKQRAVLQYAYFEGCSQAQIARTMKVSQMHISRLLRRALAQLRRLIEEDEL